ncbi:hypothetical protein GCT13_00245 [Paraburkholderia sp. CNPSo 3157]|uniref:PapC-like C-terminal domain-containing protein n=1 Tax=Paraburkholderia franconis TaxID=2654983 RepID=A0A7X1N4S4_9BURK|nr:FimD/PapC C-terminal domain-containing protein [Paraburkholderia franconis]MPW15382.1 hypothetical protein [Paraburkholderia franconis]
MPIRGLEDNGTLTVKLGDEPGQQCSVKYSLPVKSKSDKADVAYTAVESHCFGVVPAEAARN